MEDDATLVREAVAGDLTAFTAIFSRYEAQVHDFALALLRDRKAAWEVVNATFAEASERLEQLQEPHRLLVWLLAIGRFEAGLVDGAAVGLDREPVLPDDDPERVHLAGLVWEAVADLPLCERALLDLHLRHGLDGGDLADALGVTPSEGDDLRQRMTGLENGLAGFLVVRKADGRCPDLPLVLRGWDGRFTLPVAQGIAAHVAVCRVCEQSRRALPAPFTLYASARQAPLPVPDVTAPIAAPAPAEVPAASDLAAPADEEQA
jgi:DNA-directed RNA polymerase specialized sigma24 family protein